MGEIIAIAFNALKWVWGHKILAALIGVSIFAAVQTSRLATRTIERDSAQTKIEAYQKETSDATNRANDYADAVKEDRARLAERDAAIIAQNAANEALRASVQKANDVARQATADAAKAEAAFNARLTEIEAEAKAHPDQVRAVGPIVQARAPKLFE